MKKQQGEPLETRTLRRRAEEQLVARAARKGSAPPADTAKLVHELQVHQVELEMQNEELVRSRLDAEAALARYAELYDFAPVGYFALARDGAIQQCNLTGARLLGVERSGLLSRRLGAFVADNDRAAFNAAIAGAFDGQDGASCEVALVPSAARSAPAYVQITVSSSEGGLEVRAVAVDVTQRKAAEEQLRASQKMEAVGRLAGGIAHDFNNMLTVILNRCDYELKSASDAASRHNLLELQTAAEHAAALTGQLLAFSRKQVLRAEVVDVNAVVKEAARMLGPLLGEDIEIRLELAGNAGRIEVDATQLDQVILNLGINARDAMPSGGVISLSTANVELDRTQCAQRRLSVTPGSFVVVTVRDTGVGMDTGTVAHIFEPFFTTKEKGRGTGLGLATVYGVVRQCHGDISVQSELERGTAFEIYFPRTASPVTVASAPPPAAQDSAGGNETILIVEDEEAILSVARLNLDSVGYTVLTARSGAEALRVCEEHEGVIHLALSDIVMPGMSGVAFVERLRSIRPATKVLYMSGYTDESLGDRGAVAPGAHLIGKPFTADGLRRKVREVLDSRSSARA